MPNIFSYTKGRKAIAAGQRKNKLFKKNSGQTEAQKALISLDSRIKKINSEEELKWIDVTTPGGIDAPINASGTLFLLNPSQMAVGADTNRIGTQIQTTSVQIRLHMHPSTDPDASPTEMRLILFWDKQPNNALPTILRTVGTNALLDDTTVTAPVHAPYYHPSSDRFRILWDRTYDLNNMGVQDFDETNGDAELMAITAISKTLRRQLGRTTKYIDTNPGAGTIADINTNALYLMAIGNLAGAGSNRPSLYFGSRVYYKDD